MGMLLVFTVVVFLAGEVGSFDGIMFGMDFWI